MYMLLYSFILFTLIYNATSECTSESALKKILAPETVQAVTLNDDEYHIWTSLNYPEPYPYQTQTLLVKANLGYSISVIVEKLDVDGECGDLLVIKPGAAMEDEGPGKIFTFNLKSPQKFLIYSNEAYFSLRILGTNTMHKTGFYVKYQRIGQETETTTDSPTTSITWPTPSGSDSIYFTGYVAGKSQEDFKNNETVDNLKSAIAGMATEYCNTSNILLAEPITNANVHIYYVIGCPYTWPNSDTCVKIRLAVPVFLDENFTSAGYQLTTEHLEKMWNTLANNYLRNYSMSVYSEPDNNSSIKVWLIVSGTTLIFFVMLLYMVKMIGVDFTPSSIKAKIMNANNDAMSDRYRTSNLSMNPHYLQSTPPFFGIDNHSYEEFVPDVDSQKRQYSTTSRNDYTDSESEEEIIYTNFSGGRNNIEQHQKNESQS